MKLVWLTLALALTGCGGESSGDGAAGQVAAPPRETVFDPLVESAERARAVQQTVEQRAAEQRRALERLEQAERAEQ